MRNENYDIQAQGLALKEANAAIDRMVREVNPEYAPQLKAVDAGYAKFKIAQRAARGSTNADGLVTPTQFMRAVRDKDPSLDKRAFAEGKALQQDLASAAAARVPDVLPEKVNLSRLATQALAHKYGLGMLGVPGGAGMAALLAVPYSKTGSAMLRNRMTHQPAAVQKRAAQAAIFGFGSEDED
jgi:hypothetical protein